jgi:hypothetical protein
VKAVVVEVKDRYAVVLGKDGGFMKIRNSGRLCVGHEVDVPAIGGSKFNMLARAASIAAVFLITAGLGLGVYGYNMPYSYVNVDINPSVEITANVFDRIIKAEGLNSDGIKLLEGRRLGSLELREGIEAVLEAAVDEGYLKPDEENAVIITVACKDVKKAGQLGAEVQDTAAEELNVAKVEAEILVEKATIDRHDKARDLGVSPGKLNLIDKLVESKPELKSEDYKDASVKDIMKAVKDIRKGEKPGGMTEDEDRTSPDEAGGKKEERIKDDKPDSDEKRSADIKESSSQKKNSGSKSVSPVQASKGRKKSEVTQADKNGDSSVHKDEKGKEEDKADESAEVNKKPSDKPQKDDEDKADKDGKKGSRDSVENRIEKGTGEEPGDAGKNEQQEQHKDKDSKEKDIKEEDNNEKDNKEKGKKK